MINTLSNNTTDDNFITSIGIGMTGVPSPTGKQPYDICGNYDIYDSCDNSIYGNW